MEDRCPPALYLEATDLTSEQYAGARVPAVLAAGAVDRATWWENAHRDRTDLPRTVPEFGRLGVYEVGEDFHPPPPPAGVTAWTYRRTRRPGQGVLTGRPTTGLLVVLISPRDPGRAQALRDWADFVHLRHIAAAAVPGYTMITPFEHAGGGEPRFLHLYEMDTGDPEGAFRTMTACVAARIGGPETDAWRRWATTPDLRIDYVNTFRLAGEAAPA